MVFACSICSELFTPKSDVSTTPCGHVFHTSCIEKLFLNGVYECTKCRKSYRQIQIMKLYFSESDLENSLITQLEDENIKIQEEANLSKSLEVEANEKCLKFQKENSTLIEEKLAIQEDNTKLQVEKLMIQDENTKLHKDKLKIQEENLTLRDEKLRMTKHLDDLKMNYKNIENALKTKCEELTEEVMKARGIFFQKLFFT